MKKGRGRPKAMVPPSPPSESLASLKTPQIVSRTTTPPDSSSKMFEIGAKNDKEMTTTLENTIKETPTEATQAQSEERKLWVDIINDNQNPAKGLTMEYVAPKVVNEMIEIDIEQEDIETEIRFWDNAIILYVVGDDLSMNTVKNFMQRTWNFVKIPDLYYHDDGYFLLRFNSQKDKETVMMKGSYTIRNIPMILKEWQTSFNLKRDLLRTLPIWVKLPQLPLHLWGGKSLSKIGSAIRKPLVTDECTANKLHVSYARLLIKVDITQQLIDEIAIRNVEGDVIMQPMKYEWRPTFCETCQKMGHKCEDWR
ncbi:unnamed protein product [Lathyrus sativus]|nr:unnamed protein product [Lathyrus sativus]